MNSHFLDRPSTSNTTSIKRSYEQFGLDHNNSLNDNSPSASVANPNKRARSEGRSSAELESSGSSSSSNSSTRSLQSSLSAEDTSSIDILTDSHSIFSLDPSSSSASSSNGSFSTDSSGPLPINAPPPSQDPNFLVPDPYSPSWHQNSVDHSYESVMNRANDFERNIAVLRDLPPPTPSPLPQLSPSTVPLVNLFDSPLVPVSPPLPQPHSHPAYTPWGPGLQQEQRLLQHSQSNLHSSTPHENLHSINPDLPTSRQSSACPHPHPPLYHHEHPSHCPRHLSRPELGIPNQGYRSQDRNLLPGSSSLRLFERGHLALPTQNRYGDPSSHPGGNPRRDTFAVDRGHLPSFARHIDGFQPGIIYSSPSTESVTDTNHRPLDFNNSMSNEWPQEDRWASHAWANPRDATVHEHSTPVDSSRNSWFSTRPTPSNSLMSESAEQRRRRLQRHMLANFRSDTNHDMDLSTSSRRERLLDVDRTSRNVLIEDINTHYARAPRSYNHRANDSLHIHLSRTTHTTWVPPTSNDDSHSGATVHHIRDGDNSTHIDDPDFWQRRRERLVSAPTRRASPHIPSAFSSRVIPTHGSPSPTESLRQMFESSDVVPPRSTSNAVRTVTDRPGLSTMFSPPWSHHPLPEMPISRYQTPPINDDGPLPLPPEDPVPPASSIYRDINLNAYQHGPFRASLERFRAIDRMRDNLRSRLNQLDSIVTEGFSSRRDLERLRELRQSGPVSEPSHEPFPRPERNTSDYTNFTLPPLDSTGGEGEMEERTIRSRVSAAQPVRPQSPGQGSRRTQFRRRPTSETFLSMRRPTFEHPGNSNSFSHVDAEERDRREIHDLFTRRPRLEASRIDADSPTSHPHQPPPAPDGQTQGFSQALDVLRADGLSVHRQQQLIDRFHREREQDNRRTAELWGEMESRENNSTHRRPLPFRRAPARRDVPSFNFGTSGMTQSSNPSSRGAGPGRMPVSRRRSPSNSPTRGSAAEPVLNARAARGSMHRRTNRRFIGDLEGYFRFDYSHMNVPGRRIPSRLRSLGDYVRDEDFDDSFESLMSLTASLGEVKPKHTPDHVIRSLPSGIYKDWAIPGCDQRCPICLDDYHPTDQVLKISDCSHWLHKACLEQWLHSANTCPVCRKQVKGKWRSGQNIDDSQENSIGPQPGPSRRGRDEDTDDNDNDEDNDDSDQITVMNRTNAATSSRPGNGPPDSRLNWFF